MNQWLIKHIFDYEDGWLIWREGGSRDRRLRRRAGSASNRYIKLMVDGKEYLAHRLIWLWHRGYMPNYIDHIDGNGFNNRIENLRECTMTQNIGNANYGPLRGIEKHGRKYRVRICGTDWKIECGSFSTLEEAIEARDAAHREYFGEFAFVNGSRSVNV